MPGSVVILSTRRAMAVTLWPRSDRFFRMHAPPFPDAPMRPILPMIQRVEEAQCA